MSIPTRITISHLKDVLLNSCKKVKTPLGRWSSHKNKNHGLIVDYSNEDHCGSCGGYIISKRYDDKKIHININNTNELYEMEYSSMMVNTPHYTDLKEK
jgi:hypothetical protein